ncbi:MAG: M3 family oligoendopeptidase [Rickettsiales bacterium]|jgi:oligoendopeptidase F|nr:M3 family oligoendopeptidase [Rickettsiales bacterium]
MKNKTLNIIGIIAVLIIMSIIVGVNKGDTNMNFIEMARADKELQNTRWDLSDLYNSINDPQILADVEKIEKLSADFAKYRGKLDIELPNALRDIETIEKLSLPIGAYLYMRSSTDNENQEIKKIMSSVDERLTRAATIMEFFSIEFADMADDTYKKLLSDSIVIRNKSMLDEIRKNKKHLLSEKEEIILTRLSPFGSSEWGDMIDEFEAGLIFTFEDKKLKLAEIQNIMSYDENPERRENAMRVINDTLRDNKYAWMRARALNIVAGKKNTMDEVRGYKSVLSSRNLANDIDDEVVDALHTAVREYGVSATARYFDIMAKILGRDKLKWSDRNANIPNADSEYIDWENMKKIVLAAYDEFSPTMAQIARTEIIDKNHIDAPIFNGKSNGAYNYTIIDKNNRPQSFVLLNALGNYSSLQTLAHEMGHGVHGILGARKQSPLVFLAPMAYAETASVFGEMLTFEYMMSHETDDNKKFVMLMNKSKDWLNTVVRQISFSEFEKRVHEARKNGKLSVEDINKVWVDISQEFYGDRFDYSDMDYMWSYVSHFMDPFYVYSYAFGELFVQSLFAQKDKIPDFEKKYIELLESGGTKNAVELMAPFGLDPRDPEFWKKGIENSITKWLNMAEKIKMGL